MSSSFMDYVDDTRQTCPTCGLIDYQMFFGCRRCISNKYKDITLTVHYHHNGDYEHFVFDAKLPVSECYAMLKIHIKAQYDIELSDLDTITLDMWSI